MKTTAWNVGRNTTLVTMILLLVLGAGAALADDTPRDGGDLHEQAPPLCPEDPVDEMPCDPINCGGGDDVIATVVGLLVTLSLI